MTGAIAAELDEAAPFVTGWTLIVTYNDTEGEDSFACNAMTDQTRHQTFGHLIHGLAIELAGTFWDERPD